MAKVFQYQAKTEPVPIVPVFFAATLALAVSSSVIFKQKLIYQTKAEPLTTGEVVTLDKWFCPFVDPVRTRRFSPAQQDVSADFASQTVSFSWFNPLSEPVRKVTFKPSLQDFAADVAFVEDTTLYPKWGFPWSEPVRQKRGLAACQQAFQPYANIFPLEAIFEDKWHFPLSEPVRSKPGLRASLQQALVAPVLDPRTQIDYIGWYAPFGEPVRSKPGIKAAQQDQSAYLDSNPDDSTFESKWHFSWSEPVRRRIFLAQYQDVSADVYTQGEVITIDKWFIPFADPVRQKPGLQARLQQAAIGPVLSDSQLTDTIESRWHQPWSEPVRLKPGLRTQLQDSVADIAFVENTTLYPKWGYAWSEPVRLKRGLAAHQQPFQTSANIFPLENIFEDKWHYPLSEPVRLRRLATAQQQFLAHVPFVEDAAIESKWHFPWSEPVRTRYLSTAQKEALIWEPVFVSENIFEDKWHFPLSEPVRKKKGLASHLQQPIAFHPSPVVPFSYYNWLAEPIRYRRLATSEQPFAPYLQPNPTVSFGFYGWLSEPVRPKRGLQRQLQQTVAQTLLIPDPRTFLEGYYNWWSEPVRSLRGLKAYLQRATTTPERVITNQVNVTLNATETNSDTAFFMVSVFNRPVRANVSIKEISGNDSAFASIVEPSPEADSPFIVISDYLVQDDGVFVTEEDLVTQITVEDN